jgi:hypothetical protein
MSWGLPFIQPQFTSYSSLLSEHKVHLMLFKDFNMAPRRATRLGKVLHCFPQSFETNSGLVCDIMAPSFPYTECPRRKGQYSWRSQYRSFQAKKCICTCVLFRPVSEIELFHCTDKQHARSSHEVQSALMLTVEFSKMYYTR